MIYAAWLRGLNVGGKGIIPMAALKEYFEDLDFDNVVTYINSGNVVFETKKRSCRTLEKSITEALRAHFKKDVAVVVQDINEVAALIDDIADIWPGPNPGRRDVIFLRHSINKPATLDGLAQREGIDTAEYVPGAILWSVKKKDLTKSWLNKLVGTPPYKEMTIRTVGTVQKVFALMEKVQANDN